MARWVHTRCRPAEQLLESKRLPIRFGGSLYRAVQERIARYDLDFKAANSTQPILTRRLLDRISVIKYYEDVERISVAFGASENAIL